MRKLQFKKILSIIDTIELRGISLQETPVCLYEEMANEYFSMKFAEIKNIVDFIYEKGVLKASKNGIDLSPAATIYAKSNQNSSVEALSILETFLIDANIYSFFHKQLRTNPFVTKEYALRFIDNDILQLMTQTILLEVEQEKLRIHPKLLKGIAAILDEYRHAEKPLVSITLTALYSSSIVSHKDMRIDFKNTKYEMVNYENKDVILTIIPRRGIPHDRDETKALQSFYKDTLFHEFDHCCPICKINIAHMLIASHIKPFRDCAHIYEAIDHDNGLLLCRNHDYLFDQGYFTFDDKGFILLSEELLSHENLEDAFVVHKNYQLPTCYMTKNRRLFLEYHRNHIFKNAK